MQHEAIPSETPRDAFDLAAFAKSTVMSGIMAAADDKSVMKERIMLARECGFLTDTETRRMIVEHGLENA